jgi:hypothetical protein
MRWIEGNASIHRFYFYSCAGNHFLDGALANFLRVGYKVALCTTLFPGGLHEIGNDAHRFPGASAALGRTFREPATASRIPHTKQS